MNEKKHYELGNEAQNNRTEEQHCNLFMYSLLFMYVSNVMWGGSLTIVYLKHGVNDSS